MRLKINATQAMDLTAKVTTDGRVERMIVGAHKRRTWTFDGLSPFRQGYVVGLLTAYAAYEPKLRVVYFGRISPSIMYHLPDGEPDWTFQQGVAYWEAHPLPLFTGSGSFLWRIQKAHRPWQISRSSIWGPDHKRTHGQSMAG